MFSVTAFPTALTVAASWDPDLLLEFGEAVGKEHFAKNVNIMLGPGTNLGRNPFNGRLWEYFSESEVLSAAAVRSVVLGVQRSNVSTCVKHYLCNSQEFNRNTEDAIVAQRPLQELYLHSYLAAAEAGAGSFMLGVNKINGLENSANPQTLSLLFDAGFEGFFVTDWAGIVVPNASAAVLAGTSVEMPRGYQFQYIPEYLANGSLPLAAVDLAVTRVLTAAAALGLLDTPADPARNPGAMATSPEHAALARRLAARGAVLLKNENSTLPLDPASPALAKGVLVLGDEYTVTGCGSGNVRTPYIITPFAGLFSALNPNASRVNNSCTFLPNTDFFQDGAPCVTVQANASNGFNLSQACCAACSSNRDCFVFTVLPGPTCPGQPLPGTTAQCFLKPNQAGFRPHAGLTSGTCSPLSPSSPPLFYFPEALGDPAAAALLARDFSAVVVVAALPVAEPDPGCEGTDRTTLALDRAYEALIGSIATAANVPIIVVTRTGGAVLMPWLASAAAVLHMGLAGQEAGAALADVLTGAENPSGKLPITFPSSDTAHWLGTPAQYPGIFNASGDGFWRTEYSEGMNMGYRFFASAAGAAVPRPLFPFGHGLSYSTFAYSALAVAGSIAPGDNSSSTCTVSFTVTNAAGPPGRETAQLYLAGPLPGDAPALKAFGGSGVIPSGGSVRIALTLRARDLTFYNDQGSSSWEPYKAGLYNFSIGASSVDLRLFGSVAVV
jgi:beta-glucosidase